MKFTFRALKLCFNLSSDRIGILTNLCSTPCYRPWWKRVRRSDNVSSTQALRPSVSTRVRAPEDSSKSPINAVLVSILFHHKLLACLTQKGYVLSTADGTVLTCVSCVNNFITVFYRSDKGFTSGY